MFAQLVKLVDRVRTQAHAATAEYRIQTKIPATSDDSRVDLNSSSLSQYVNLPKGTKAFPYYPYIDSSEHVNLLRLLREISGIFLIEMLGFTRLSRILGSELNNMESCRINHGTIKPGKARTQKFEHFVQMCTFREGLQEALSGSAE